MRSLHVQDFENCLVEIQPRIGNYEWMWKLMRSRSRNSGWLPSRMYRILKRLGNPRKPYFFGETADGIKFVGDYRDRWSVSNIVLPGFDVDIRNTLRSLINESPGAFFDLGANLGIVSAAMARHLSESSNVYAFEPVADTAKRAAATFALNGLKNIVLFPIAVGDTDGEITFYDAPGRSEGASANRADFESDTDWGGWNETKVSCRTLDGLRSDGAIPERAGIIKIDVEGNDLKAITGASVLIGHDRPAIIFEYFPYVAKSAGWQVTDATRVLSTITSFDFQILKDGEFSPFPPLPESEEIVDIYCKPK